MGTASDVTYYLSQSKYNTIRYHCIRQSLSRLEVLFIFANSRNMSIFHILCIEALYCKVSGYISGYIFPGEAIDLGGVSH